MNDESLFYQRLSRLLVVLVALLLVRYGLTWQIVPFTILALAASALLSFKKTQPWWYLWLPSLLFGLISLGLLFLFPNFTITPPSGNYRVGVTYQTITTHRDESLTPEQGDSRTIYLKIWYPASSTEMRFRNPYVEGAAGMKKLAGSAGLPGFVFNHLTGIETNGYTDADIAQGSFPLLTFSHGYGAWFGQNTPLMEELASRGFIVASIAHSHQTIFAASGPREALLFPEIVELAPEDSTFDMLAAFSAFFEEENPELRSELFYKIWDKDSLINQNAQYWAMDIQDAIDQMLTLNQDSSSRFFEHVDSAKIGSFGMSFGGAASAEVTFRDSRVKAAINMDGFQYGTWAKDTVRVPVLILEGEHKIFNAKLGNSMYFPLNQRSTAPFHALMFLDAEHWNFTDANLISPQLFRWFGLSGDIDPAFMIESMNKIVPDFFTSIFEKGRFDDSQYLQDPRIKTPRF